MTNTLPFVSIILLNYNGRPFLDECLLSLSRIDYPRTRYEVIMADNGSTDGSVEYVDKSFPWVKILPLQGNYGYTGGNNRGVEFTQGDLIAFLNDDTAVETQWLKELVKPLVIDERIAICGSKILLMDTPDQIQYAGGFLNLIGGTIFCPVQETNQNREFYLVGSICGASFIIRRKVYETLGGFDESFFMYSDENDLCLRAWIFGYRVAYAPRSIVHHFGEGNQEYHIKSRSSSILEARVSSPLRLYHGNKNSIASLLKNFELKDLLSGILLSLMYGAVQLTLVLRRGEPTELTFLMRGYLWPIRNLKDVWSKRLMIQKRRKISDLQLKRMGLLLSAARMINITLSQIPA